MIFLCLYPFAHVSCAYTPISPTVLAYPYGGFTNSYAQKPILPENFAKEQILFTTALLNLSKTQAKRHKLMHTPLFPFEIRFTVIPL